MTDVYRTRAGVQHFSVDTAEEARLLCIRDTPGARVRLIAQARVEDPTLPLHVHELRWLREAITATSPIELLRPVEWDALARTLLAAIREVHVIDARREWERRAGYRAIPELVERGLAEPEPGPETRTIPDTEDS